MQDQPTEKRCPKCGETKALDDFYRDRRSRDGRGPYCKPCHAAGVRASRERNAEKRRERDRRYRAENRDRIREYQQRYQKEHVEQGVERVRRWRARHPEQNRAHRILNTAVFRGKVTKPEACERCGIQGPVDGHHEDYSQPLDVAWLCKSCHVIANKDRLAREALSSSPTEER